MKNVICFIILSSLINLSAIIINIPEDFDSIQEGLNFASAGDTILVAEGIYFENIIWPDIEDIKVIGVSRESTIIDGNYVNRVIDFDNDYNIIDENTLLKNLTIRNGFTQGGGAGIFYHNSKPSLINLIITNNESVFRGGGIMCFNYSHTIIENVIFSNNTASEGGAINCDFSSNALLINCKLLDNISESCGGGIVAQGGSNIDVYNTLIYNNSATYGGAVITGEKGTVDLINCTVVANNASEIGGAIYAYGGVDLLNCILWDNSIPAIDGFVSATYSDIQEGLVGVGNIDAIPLFNDPLNGDYHLTENSPCIDAGDPNSPLDPDGTIADMGAYFFYQINEINENEIEINKYYLSNYPNPFNPTTTISFSILEESKIELFIYNVKGQKIKTLLNDQISAGEHSIVWNGEDDNNKPVSSGVYLYRLRSDEGVLTSKKMLFVK
ncbi:MAG: T9SS type A sorting domain-containing protein [Candidatus Tenebribacter burtonii]|nr:T9SS type A sorting domain-containing protein [Candidatus Tenebribacter burtonii]